MVPHLLLILLLLACGEENARTGFSALTPGQTACEAREGGSRWAAVDGEVQIAAEYGQTSDEELTDVWGIAATPSGDLLVWDAGDSRVKRLGNDLRLLRTYGREGEGPGEFVYQRVPHGEWLAVEDSSFFVLGLRGLSEFQVEHGFVRRFTPGVGFPVPVQRIGAWSGQIFYGWDELDTQDGTRVFETRTLDSDDRPRLLRTDVMPTLPRWQGQPVRGMFADQAEPLWAMGRGCAFLSDGAGDWVLAVDVATNRADTLRLPPREIPERTAEDEARFEEIRRSAARVGISAGSPDMEPTARVKWSGMRVDPDGFVWLEPWRPHSRRNDPVRPWVIDPRSGAVDSVEVPRFPVAFLPDGSFVARRFDSAGYVDLIQKFALDGREEGGTR